jgi:hypothetical protein
MTVVRERMDVEKRCCVDCCRLSGKSDVPRSFTNASGASSHIFLNFFQQHHKEHLFGAPQF